MNGPGRPPLPLPGFRTAKEIYEDGRALSSRAGIVDPTEPVRDEEGPGSCTLIVAECTIDRARTLWGEYLRLRDLVLSDPACFDEIADHREMNRTGATRLAVLFGLSIEQRQVTEGRVQDPDTGDWDYRFQVGVRVGKGARFVDGIGSCRLSEIPERTRAGDAVPVSVREHFALSRAWTRAVKRAIGDILGGAERKL